MTFDLLGAFYAACPGIVLTRDIDSALHAAAGAGSLTGAQILTIVLPLVPEGNPPQYTRGSPPAVPVLMPNATPIFAAALPPQPNVAIPIDGGSNPGTGTVLTFAKGLKRFADSNPEALDGWSIEREQADGALSG
jgi:hypothetical protein